MSKAILTIEGVRFIMRTVQAYVENGDYVEADNLLQSVLDADTSWMTDDQTFKLKKAIEAIQHETQMHMEARIDAFMDSLTT